MLWGASGRKRRILGYGSTLSVSIRTMSKRKITRSRRCRTFTRTHDLESLGLSTTDFAVTEIRDVTYDSLHLAKDVADSDFHASRTSLRNNCSFLIDYSQHPVDVYIDFLCYCIKTPQTINIIRRPWALWPRTKSKYKFEGRKLASWINVASYAPNNHMTRVRLMARKGNLVGSPVHTIYAASHQINSSLELAQNILQTTGLIVAKADTVSARIIDGTVPEDCLQMLGWHGGLDHGIPDNFWRTLVANRTADGRMISGWYRQACALALTKLTDEGDLSFSKLVAKPSHPNTMIEYLKRVQDVVRSHEFFFCSPQSAQRGQTHESARVVIPDATEVAILSVWAHKR
jgi:hypothetical protein